MKNLLFVILAFLFSSFLNPYIHGQEHGLCFSSYNVLKDQRTGLNLTPDKAITFREDFELSFDISVHEPNKYNFGYIFRIILNENHNIDLIHKMAIQREFYTLINNQEKKEISFSRDSGLQTDQWENFRIQFLLSDDKILVHFFDTTLIQEKAGLKIPTRAKIFFGAGFDDAFANTEVPPIKIKDVKITQGKRIKFHWPLSEFKGETAREVVRGKHAKVYNPIWLRRDHVQWEFVREINIGGYAIIAPDSHGNKIYFMGSDQMVTLHLESNNLDTISISEDPFLCKSYYQAVFDGKNVISYHLNANQLISVDPSIGKIKNLVSTVTPRRDFLHHNKYLDTTNHLLYIINGYGHYTYRNEVMLCDTKENEWKEVSLKGDVYPPRYLAASGELNDTIFVLGGYGSISGNQKLNPQYFYDLNAISLDELSCQKIHDYIQPEKDFCFANSLVIDSATRNFYGLSFPKHKFESELQLVTGSLDNNSLIKIGAPLPYLFNDINSFADLYYFSDLKKMYAVTLYSKDYSSSEIRIYSIRYPAFPEPFEETDLKSWGFYAVFVTIAIILIVLTLLFLKKKKHILPERKSRKAVIVEDIKGRINKNAIFFFNGFQVLDRNGVDITPKFTKLLKELFLLILFKSAGNSKGISSEKLIEILWFDKSEKSGKNNLSVNLAKLKEILRDLDGCSINHDTSYWKLITDKDKLFVEYLEVMEIVENQKSELSSESLTYLLDSVNEGQFLINVEYEWLDYYKGIVSDKIVDTLISYAESLDPKKDASLIIRIVNTIFNFDSVNEEAMILKCRTQRDLGKHSLSKKTYENFCKEYLHLYGEKFDKPFGSIINQSTPPSDLK